MSSSDSQTDALLQIVLNVVQELWVVKDRQIILEQVLQDAGIDAGAVNDYQPTAQVTERLQHERRRLLEKCLAPADDIDGAA